MKRYGALLKFKEGVTPEQAAIALQQIQDILELPQETTEYVGGRWVDVEIAGKVQKQQLCQTVKRPFRFVDLVQEYDDRLGEPVWYIP